MQKEARLPILKSRLNELMGNRSATRFAEDLGLSRQTVGFYLNGDRIPDAATLIQICQKCNVSSDWLLGLSDVKKPDMSIKATCAFTGLSEKAVNYLRTMCLLHESMPSDNRIAILSEMLERKPFDDMLAKCARYIYLMSMDTSVRYQTTAEYSAISDVLKQHGFVISVPDEQANALFSEEITNRFRMILDKIAETCSEKPKDSSMIDLDEFLGKEQ